MSLPTGSLWSEGHGALSTCSQKCLSSLECLPGMVSFPGPVQGHTVEKTRLLEPCVPLSPLVSRTCNMMLNVSASSRMCLSLISSPVTLTTVDRQSYCTQLCRPGVEIHTMNYVGSCLPKALAAFLPGASVQGWSGHSEPRGVTDLLWIIHSILYRSGPRKA